MQRWAFIFAVEYSVLWSCAQKWYRSCSRYISRLLRNLHVIFTIVASFYGNTISEQGRHEKSPRERSQGSQYPRWQQHLGFLWPCPATTLSHEQPSHATFNKRYISREGVKESSCSFWGRETQESTACSNT